MGYMNLKNRIDSLLGIKKIDKQTKEDLAMQCFSADYEIIIGENNTITVFSDDKDIPLSVKTFGEFKQWLGEYNKMNPNNKKSAAGILSAEHEQVPDLFTNEEYINWKFQHNFEILIDKEDEQIIQTGNDEAYKAIQQDIRQLYFEKYGIE